MSSRQVKDYWPWIELMPWGKNFHPLAKGAERECKFEGTIVLFMKGALTCMLSDTTYAICHFCDLHRILFLSSPQKSADGQRAPSMTVEKVTA